MPYVNFLNPNGDELGHASRDCTQNIGLHELEFPGPGSDRPVPNKNYLSLACLDVKIKSSARVLPNPFIFLLF